jgi:PAS domain S-box-containing protein
MTANDDELAAEWPPTPNTQDPARHRDQLLVMRVVRDFDGYVVSVNPAYQTVLGWSIEELSSVPYWELLHPDDQDHTVENSQQMLLSGPGSLIGLEVRMLSRDGSYRLVHWNARSVPQQERVYSVGVDITDSEPIETGKRVLVGSWDWHIPTNTATWSDGMFEIYGLAPRPPCSREAAVAHIHVDDQAAVTRAIHRSLTSEEPYVADHRIVHPSGDIRWLHSAGRVIIGNNGDLERMRGITQDVTARPESRSPRKYWPRDSA